MNKGAKAVHFEIKDETLIIHAESCNVDERQDSTFTRKIIKLDGESLVLCLLNERKGYSAELTWKKKISL